MIETDVQTQIDFSGGQVNLSAQSRQDLPAVATGGVQFLNFRPEAQGTALSRPGRTAVCPGFFRTEIVRMEEGLFYFFSFAPGEIVITDTLGNPVTSSTSGSYTWTNATVGQISFAYGNYQVCICFPGMQPETVTWSPSTQAWTFAPFAFVTESGNVQEPFFRQSVLGASMSWSTNGPYNVAGSSIALFCSSPFFTNAMVGSRLSVLGGQVLIAAVGSDTPIVGATVTVLTALPDTIQFVVNEGTQAVELEQIASSSDFGIDIEVVQITFDTIVGPLTNFRSAPIPLSVTPGNITTVSANLIALNFSVVNNSFLTSTIQWLEEFMSDFQGWPAAVAFGNDRFIFSSFAQRQEAILWTEVGELTSAYIDSLAAVENAAAGALATSAILEFMDGKPKVLNVVDTGDEFIFTDKGVFFIPLAVSGTALIPGSVAFRQVTNDGCSSVRPIPILQSVLYANAAGDRISVVKATGSFTLPYSSDDLTDVHSDLFNSPRVIAVSAGDASPDRLVYVVNGDMTVVVGKYSARTGTVGWHPESGLAPTSWIATDAQSVWYSSIYPNGNIVELENAADFLDSTISPLSPPANLVVSGKGPFWWLAADDTVTLAQNGVDFGDRLIDSNGNILFNPNENPANFTALVAGTPVAKTWQPVIKSAGPGPSRGQRMRRRAIKRALLKIEASAEFQWGSRIVPAYLFDTDQSQPANFAPIKVIVTRPVGRAYLPVIVLTSVRFGQIRLIEFSAEVTV